MKLPIIMLLIFSACSPRTGMYLITYAELKNQHELLTVKGIHLPIELSTCTAYKTGDSIFLNFTPKYSLFK